MKSLLSNPQGLLLLCCVGGLILGLNLTLLGMLRGDSRVRLETSRWASAITGNRDVRRQQDADYAQLRQRVSELGPRPDGEHSPKPPTDG